MFSLSRLTFRTEGCGNSMLGPCVNPHFEPSNLGIHLLEIDVLTFDETVFTGHAIFNVIFFQSIINYLYKTRLHTSFSKNVE